MRWWFLATVGPDSAVVWGQLSHSLQLGDFIFDLTYVIFLHLQCNHVGDKMFISMKHCSLTNSNILELFISMKHFSLRNSNNLGTNLGDMSFGSILGVSQSQNHQLWACLLCSIVHTNFPLLCYLFCNPTIVLHIPEKNYYSNQTFNALECQLHVYSIAVWKNNLISPFS